ncbi:MAG: Rpn family recombination-promoting nuclease/putative transposase [Bacilli bacterium]|nr:Rpn family recombination-promoting nuclease/putative transposase [Bacilli bacterium]
MKTKRIFGLRYDPIFKNIYFKEKNMKKLMKDLFHEDLEDFHYEKQELPKSNVNLSSGVCDIVMKSSKRIMILEIQNVDLKNLVERVKYYSSEMYSNQNPGEDYKRLLPVEVYLIVNFPFGEKQVLKEYEEFEKKLKEQLGNVSKIKIWNIKVALKEKVGLDYDYARLFTLDDKGRSESGKEVLKRLESKEEYEELVKSVKYYNMDTEMYQRLKEVEKMEMTFEQATAGFFREGREQGIIIGEKRGEKRGEKIGVQKKEEEVIQNMLMEGFPLETIMKIAKIPRKKAEKYQKSISMNVNQK